MGGDLTYSYDSGMVKFSRVTGSRAAPSCATANTHQARQQLIARDRDAGGHTSSTFADDSSRWTPIGSSCPVLVPFLPEDSKPRKRQTPGPPQSVRESVVGGPGTICRACQRRCAAGTRQTAGVTTLDPRHDIRSADSGWMHNPLMSLLKAIDGEMESYGPRRGDIRKLAFLVGPRAQTAPDRSPMTKQCLRRLSTLSAHPILLNGGGPGGM